MIMGIFPESTCKEEKGSTEAIMDWFYKQIILADKGFLFPQASQIQQFKDCSRLGVGARPNGFNENDISHIKL